ncbi:MAG: hypothetical protein L3J35_09150 [Bacteroidales bacterium]|nr:hypothetical protein [Bacteroidales bacterium]
MKNKFYIISFVSVLIISLISLHSCRKNFSLDELSKMKNDSLHFEGSIAVPLVNTELTLINFVPANDSSLWLEVDDTDLIHIRMYYKNLVSLTMREMYPVPTVVYPAPAGYSVPANTHQLTTDTSKMKVYDRMLSGKLFFDNPKFSFIIENEIPVVTYFKMDTLTFYNYDTLAISHTDHTEYNIPAPTVQGTRKDTVIIIDTVAIPVLADVFAPVPRFISFYLSTGSHNPQVLPFGVTGDERMNISVDIDLPLDARLDTIIMSDTMNFAWDGDTYEQIKSATLKIRLDNGFPIDGYSQIYFADTTDQGGIGNIVDSVFTDISHPAVTEEGWHLLPAETDAQGIVTFTNESEILIFLDQERVSFLKNSHASKMIITGKLNSYNSNTGLFVKILGGYKMGVQIAIKADFDASTK